MSLLPNTFERIRTMLKSNAGFKKTCPALKSILFIALLSFIITAVFAVVGCTGESKTLMITEVVSANSKSLTDSVYGSPDWLELYNPTGSKIDLSGYKLINKSQNVTFTFPDRTAIDAGSYMIVYCIEGTQPGEGKMIANFNLSDSGVLLSLCDKDGAELQALSVPALNLDISYAARKNGKFGFTASPTAGAANNDSSIYNTIEEARANVSISDDLCITEVMRGDEGWVEVYNPTEKTIDLHSFYLTDNKEKTDKWHFPSYKLDAGKYAVVYLMGSTYTGEKIREDDGSGIPSFNADFKLSSQENTICLYNGYGSLKDEIVFDVSMPTAVSAVHTNLGIAYTAFPTKGFENSEKTFPTVEWKSMDDTDAIRITEVLPDNKFGITDKDGERNDWVEIHNFSDQPVSLLGYYLSDSSSNPSKWAFPDVTLDSGEYLVVFLSKKDITSGDELHASFGLSSKDEGIFLSSYDGMRMDAIYIPEELHSNVSIGRDEAGEIRYYALPTPGAANTTVGFADYMGVGGFNPSSCYISETCSVQTPRSGLLDWIELHNGSNESITLSGWHISDDDMELALYDLSHITIPAGGYAVIECSSSILDQNPSVAPFGLSPSGETLILTDGTGCIVDVFETGTNKLGVTSGRVNSSENGERVYFTAATKGFENAEVYYMNYAAAPVFSSTDMYHTEPFDLEISAKNADAVIRYTLDGSKPTANSPVYSSALSISSNTVVRAATFVEGVMPSDVVSFTYIFDEPHSIPVVCLAMDEGDFAEVYAVNKPFVPVVERECYMQFFEANGQLGVQSAAGVRVSGAGTRAYNQKSLGIYFRSGYGQKEITYPFFGEKYYKTFYSLVLRNAGQDYSKSRIRDSFASKTMIGMNIDTSESRFTAVYINGKYWGLYDLKENMNKDFLATHFGVDTDTVNVIKRNTMELQGSNADFIRVRAFAAHFDEYGGNSYVIPMTDDRYEQFKQWVDVESFMDYLIARSYLSDFDMFNQKYWRTTDYAIKWRAIFFDSDFALSSADGNVLSNYFNVKGVPSANGSLSQMDIYCGLNSNESWRHDFIVRYIYIMKYHLTTERLTTLLDTMVSEMDTEMDRHIARWGIPASRNVWEAEVTKLRNAVIARPEIAASQLRNFYGISEEAYRQYEAEADKYYEEHGGLS